MGRLHKRGTTYYADYVDRRGKRIQRSLRTQDRVVATARLRDLELATTDSGAHASETLTVTLDYFTEIVCADKAAATRGSYAQKARHLVRVLGEPLVDEITRSQLERYIATRLDEGAHSHTIYKELVVLRGALTSAVSRDVFHGAVAKLVPRFRPRYVPRETYLTPEQFTQLLRHIVAPPAPKARPATITKLDAKRTQRTLYVLLLAFAAPRRGELELLDWRDVDLEHDAIRVPKGKTKSRVVPIHPTLRPHLVALRRESGAVVTPWNNDKRELARACERAGIPRVTPNDLRRTFATWLKQSDIDSAVVAAMLGHSSTAMVDRVYGKLDATSFRRAIEKLPSINAETSERLSATVWSLP